jgi:hypothetical protein
MGLNLWIGRAGANPADGKLHICAGTLKQAGRNGKFETAKSIKSPERGIDKSENLRAAADQNRMPEFLSARNGASKRLRGITAVT